MTDASTKRVPTGIPGLDELLEGGILPNANIMLEGEPGAGKSTIAMQYLLGGIELGEPGVYITLEESPTRIYRDAAGFGWDFRRLEAENRLRVIATSPEAMMEQIEKRGPLVDIVRQIDAKRAVVDTVSLLQEVAGSSSEFRLLLASLLRGLERENLRPLFIVDQDPTSSTPISGYWARYLADVLVRLETQTQHSRLTRRSVQIVKSRGQNHIDGIHSYKIDSSGVTIFPRIMPHPPEVAQFPFERIASGISGLDELLDDGFVKGECIIASGPTGSGKTISALHFLAEGARNGEPSLLLSTEAPPAVIVARAHSVGLDIEPLVEKGLFDIEYIIETELSMDEALFRLRKRLEDKAYARVAVDALNSIENMSPDPSFVSDAMLYLARLITCGGATAYLTYETRAVTGNVEVTGVSASAIADAILLFRLVELEGSLKKGLTILKHRNSAHATDIRQVMIDENGMRVLSGFEGYQGLLTGIPVVLPRSAYGPGPESSP